MNVNIFGSTGEIGTKTLDILDKNFSDIKINFLFVKDNYKKLIIQSKKYRPNIISIKDQTKIKFLTNSLKDFNIKILHPNKVKDYLNSCTSDFSILAISGHEALNYLESIFKNTKYLGLVNKECIVSAGHLLKNLKKNNDVCIYPLDSEHYSIFRHIKNKKKFDDLRSVYLTASGGPFLNKPLSKFKQITFNEAINHPKWSMGYKNSIDSATLSNKCLEIIEAHYLFNIPFDKLKISIHPEALIHSIIEYNDYNSVFNYFYPDMYIPIFNFFKSNIHIDNNLKPIKKYFFDVNTKMNFTEVDLNRYPILKIFNKIDKSDPKNLIKFNLSNEYAVNLFKNNLLSFNEIALFVNKSLKIKLNLPVNNIQNIINYHNKFKLLLDKKNV